MFRKKTPAEAPALWIASSDLPTTAANSFYQKLDGVLAERQFGEHVRRLCALHYEMDARKGGQPGIDPEVYFKMLMVGFFENLTSERAIAARCVDSLSIRKTTTSHRSAPLWPKFREILERYLAGRPPSRLLFPSYRTG